MLILYTTVSCSTAGEGISTALYCKHWSYSPTPEDIPEPSHGRVFCEKFCSVYVVKGVWSLLTEGCKEAALLWSCIHVWCICCNKDFLKILGCTMYVVCLSKKLRSTSFRYHTPQYNLWSAFCRWIIISRIMHLLKLSASQNRAD